VTVPSVSASRDRVVRIAPLGLRLWDLAVDAPAQPGLHVTCRLPGGRQVTALRTPSGCYAVRSVPGLHAAEYPEDETHYWYHPPARTTARVEIIDSARRYLPLALAAELPHRGLVQPFCRAPGPEAPVVPLFSSPVRPVPAGVAVVRAQLELVSGGPASWAHLTVHLPDAGEAYGMADGRGSAAVFFPWPEPQPPADGADAVPLRLQEWTVTVAARFGRTVAGVAVPVAESDGVPELCTLLTQRPARLLAGLDDPLPAARLVFGRDLVLRSPGRSTLLLESTP
jgi:hypothetical protein